MVSFCCAHPKCDKPRVGGSTVLCAYHEKLLPDIYHKDTFDVFLYWADIQSHDRTLGARFRRSIARNAEARLGGPRRTIIAGSRTITRLEYVQQAMRKARLDGVIPGVVIEGDAGGVDRLAKSWAQLHGIPCEVYPADWTKGKSAGYARNETMADIADSLVAIWDGESKGTAHMIEVAERKGLDVRVYYPIDCIDDSFMDKLRSSFQGNAEARQ